MIIRQIKIDSFLLFCYVLGCETTGKGVVIDPGGNIDIIYKVIQDCNLDIIYIINTHFHADHTLGNQELKKLTKAKIVLHALDKNMLVNEEAEKHFKKQGLLLSPEPDITVVDGEILPIGTYSIKIIHTPGHSPGSICLLCEGNLFTGDALFVGAAGRTDLPGGDFETQLSALEEKILPLPGDTVIWPGHDYGDEPTSTIDREKKENPFLGGEW